MGMSSSQARLLTLTARMHDIEYRAAKLEAQKLQLGNDSRRVYENYLRALDAKKVQFKTLTSNGSVTFTDATLAALENGSVNGYDGITSQKTYLLQNAETGTLFLTKDFADQYGIQASNGTEIGTLEQWLDENDCPTRKVKVPAPDWSNVESITPVYDVKAGDPGATIIDPSTWAVSTGGIDVAEIHDDWSMNSVLTPAFVDEGSYSNTMPDMSVTEATLKTKEIVNASTFPTALTVPTTPSSSDTLQTVYSVDMATYKKFAGCTLQLTDAQLDSQLKDIDFGQPINFASGSLNNCAYCYCVLKNNLSLDYSNDDGYNAANAVYYGDGTMTLRELLEQHTAFDSYFEFEDNVTFDSENNIMYSDYPFFFLSEDGPTDYLVSNYLLNNIVLNYETEEKTLGLNTNMLEYVLGKTSRSGRSLASEPPTIKINGSDISYNGTEDMSNITFDDYLKSVQTYVQDNTDSTFSYRMDSTTGKLIVTIDGNESFDIKNLTKNQISKTTADTYNISVNLDALAKQIYLGRAVAQSGGTTVQDFDDNADDINDIKTTLVNNSNTEDKTAKRTIALISKDLEDALNAAKTGNNTLLNSVITNINTYLSSGSYTATSANADKYLDVPGTDDGHGNIHNLMYNFVFDETAVSFTRSTTPNVPDGVNTGSISNAPKDDDIKEYFAKVIFDECISRGSAKTYAACKTQMENYGLNSYELCHLYYCKDDSSLINALVNGSSIDTWKNAASPKLEWNSTNYPTIDRNGNSDNFNYNPSSGSPSRDDVFLQIAYDIHETIDDTVGDINAYATTLKTAYSSLSDEDIASISFYKQTGYETQWNAILTAAKAGSSLSAYTSKFDGQVFAPDSSKLTAVNNDYVTCDNISDIATRIAGDIYAKEIADHPDSVFNANTLKNKIQSLFSNQELASLSSYYGNSTAWNTIISNLYGSLDRTNAGVDKSTVSSYTTNFAGKTLTPNSSSDLTITEVTHSHTGKGLVKVPTYEGIASNLLEAFRQNGNIAEGSELTVEQIANKISAKYPDDTNQASLKALADINDVVAKFLKNGDYQGDLTNIYNHIMGTGSLSITGQWDGSEYDFVIENLGNCSVRYGTKYVDGEDDEWDTDSDEYKDLVKQYNAMLVFKDFDIEIIDDDRVDSVDFIAKYADSNLGIYLEFDAEKFEEDNKVLIEMPKTSVAVETSLQEVQDEKELKKAEAKYEADMKRIDMKDRRYDSELAALDGERNAIKQEMDTLKTVAKDNVERTFKLFG